MVQQTVELFCGQTKAFSSIAEALGFAIFTVDINPAVSPSLVADIKTVNPGLIPSAPLIVWAAPPYCPVFRDRKSWEADGSFHPLTSEAEDAVTIIRKTISLLSELEPTWWFIEHPKSYLRKMPLFAGFNRGYPTRNRQTIRHNEYGGGAATETDVWTNAYWWIPRPGERDGPAGSDVGRRVPPFVFAEIFEQLETYQLTGRYGPRSTSTS